MKNSNARSGFPSHPVADDMPRQHLGGAGSLGNLVLFSSTSFMTYVGEFDSRCGQFLDRLWGRKDAWNATEWT